VTEPVTRTIRKSTPRRDGWARRSLLAAALLGPLRATPCGASEVQVVAVTPGVSADVVIDGGAPITLEIGGEPVEGVTLLETRRSGAVLRIDDVVRTVPLGGVYAEDTASAQSRTVALSADAQGHFVTRGTINGRSVRFLVDTGATLTTLSRREADRIGLDYRRGALQQTVTANGTVQGWRVSLATVGVASATASDVEAMVLDSDALQDVLLGMSFLGRFDMRSQGSTLVLRRR
jgi:aspartyl protease family protein